MQETILGIGLAVAGASMAVAGVGLRVKNTASEEAAAYLSGFDPLDESGASLREPVDERLSESLLTRMLSPVLARIENLATMLSPADQRIRIREQLAKAGLDTTLRPEEVLAAQVLGGTAGLILGGGLVATQVIPAAMGLILLVLLVMVGLCTPMVWLNRKVEQRQTQIRYDLADMLDLLAISVEAGTGLEGAMQLVAARMDSPLARELSRALREMELGLSRRDALGNLRKRSTVAELSSFIHALIQADALGMPLGRVLKIQAADMRLKRRQWAREKAAKLPVKILIPLVFCIFPAVLVVIGGPVVSQIGSVFK